MQMKDKAIAHIAMKSKFDISPQGGGNSPECRSMQHTSTFRGIPGPLGQNVKFALHTYVRNRVIFHLHPVPSKNIEKRLQNSALKKKFCEKFFFRRRGFPKIAKKSDFFHIFKEKGHINTLRPKWDILGVKWRYDTTDKLENAKIEICLVPLP